MNEPRPRGRPPKNPPTQKVVAMPAAPSKPKTKPAPVHMPTRNMELMIGAIVDAKKKKPVEKVDMLHLLRQVNIFYTQEEIAERLKVSQGTMSMWVNNKKEIPERLAPLLTQLQKELK